MCFHLDPWFKLYPRSARALDNSDTSRETERHIATNLCTHFDDLRVLAVDCSSALVLVEPLARAAKSSLDFGDRCDLFAPFALLASSSPSANGHTREGDRTRKTSRTPCPSLCSIRTLAHVWKTLLYTHLVARRVSSLGRHRGPEPPDRPEPRSTSTEGSRLVRT